MFEVSDKQIEKIKQYIPPGSVITSAVIFDLGMLGRGKSQKRLRFTYILRGNEVKADIPAAAEKAVKVLHV